MIASICIALFVAGVPAHQSFRKARKSERRMNREKEIERERI
jgi:hypothetical protein